MSIDSLTHQINRPFKAPVAQQLTEMAHKTPKRSFRMPKGEALPFSVGIALAVVAVATKILILTAASLSPVLFGMLLLLSCLLGGLIGHSVYHRVT